MDNAFIRYVFDKKKQADNSNNTGLLQIEVREKGKNSCVYISTGIKLYKNQFSDKNGFTCVKHNNATAITAKARRIFTKIESFVLSKDCTNIRDAKNYDSSNRIAEREEVVPFIIKTLSSKNYIWNTLKTHNTLIHHLKQFKRIKYFKDLTYENIVLFDEHLRKTNKQDASVNKRHSTFRSYIIEAKKYGLVDKDPYDLFQMPSKKSKEPVFLESEEVKKILEYIPLNEKLLVTKDLFTFQMFTGFSYVDLMNFNSDVISEMEGYKVIRSSRTKTDESFISIFLPEAEAIADKYNYELPKISNQKYNDYLKLLAAGAGINKNLTSHVARHTYATYLLNKGIPIETVSRAMGHSNIKMTQHYAKLLGKKVVSDMAILLKKEEK